jgi:glycosyltransferase involved in cell wall biosynthesis
VAGEPLVSVVLPTYHRPDLVLRAVHSVLDQTLKDLEVIVVVDGRDPPTVQALSSIDDVRLSVHVPDRHLGNADARNTGVTLARAPWVAFLDDDDTWHPAKLERQVPLAEHAPCASPIVTCRILARDERGDMVWPRRVPAPGEDWSEYLFCRRTPFTGEGIVTTSSILTSRTLLLELPFTSGLVRQVDPDWLLRAVRLPGVCVEFVPDREPLVVWYLEHGRPRVTTRTGWADSYDWCRRNRVLFSARGYAAFVLHVVGSQAAAQHEWRAFPVLLREAFAGGRPAPVDVASHIANFALPATVQRSVAIWYARLVSSSR